jgi:subtilisin family serine protease
LLSRRNLTRLCAVFAAAGIVAGLGSSPGAAAAAPDSTDAPSLIKGADGPHTIPDSYIVTFKESVDAQPASLAALTGSLAAKHHASVTNTYQAALRGFAATMERSQAELLATDPAVADVYADHQVTAQDTQVNPASWGLDRIDQRDLPLTQSYTYQSTASNVHVYLLDTGIRTTHTEFSGRAVWETNTIDTNNTDCNGHGTHVAGTIGGVKYGVAKGVRLHAVKVLNCAASGTESQVIAGVDWVTAHRIKPAVVNMSLRFLTFGTNLTALDVAVGTSIASGITYVVAAGNDTVIACRAHPARQPAAITVGATWKDDTVWGFTNTGSCLDTWAPGVNILSATHLADSQTVIHAIKSGTSMATAHVTGVAAIYLAGHPTASPAKVHDYVKLFNASVDRVTRGTLCCGPLVHSLTTPPGPGTNTLHKGQELRGGQSIRSQLGNHILHMQHDGNLVHYQGSRALWASNTENRPGARVVLQTDGNLVIYLGTAPIWASNTAGTPVDRLVMQDDANLVLYGPGNQPFWDSR